MRCMATLLVSIFLNLVHIFLTFPVSAEQILKDVLAPNTDAEMVLIMIKVRIKLLMF